MWYPRSDFLKRMSSQNKSVREWGRVDKEEAELRKRQFQAKSQLWPDSAQVLGWWGQIMFGLKARELSFKALALTQGCLRGQTPSVFRQAAIIAQHNLSKRAMHTGRATQSLRKGSEGIWEELCYGNSVCYKWGLPVSPAAAFLALPSWKGCPSSLMRMGLKLCGSS